MPEEQTSEQPQQQTPPAQPVPTPPPTVEQEAGEKGFPANTPLSEMSVEQREAYWKDKARLHESRAKERSDYEQVKAENARLKQEHETENEKAIREAREAGAAEARQQAMGDRLTDAARLLLRARNVNDDDITAFVTETNLTAFLTDDGRVDDARLMARVDRYAGTASGSTNSSTRPDMGQGRRGGNAANTGIKAGAALYDEMHGKTTTTS